jgi:hypothetical protein
MSLPLRKDQPEIEDDLTTADLAQGKRPAASDRADEVGPQEVRPNQELRSTDRTNEVRSNDSPKPVLTSRPGQSPQAATSEARNAADATPLFPSNELDDLRNRWNSVQGTFVDEPRRAVEQADGLVASAMKRLAEVFAQERSNLEQQWDRGDNVSTEDLRIALQRYRSFFQRLLSI